MNKEKILERIKLLEDERTKCITTFNAIEGAIQDNKYWLDNLESKDKNQEGEQKDG